MESEKHKNLKKIVSEIMVNEGYRVSNEVHIVIKGKTKWIVDVHAEKDGKRILIECGEIWKRGKMEDMVKQKKENDLIIRIPYNICGKENHSELTCIDCKKRINDALIKSKGRKEKK